MTDDFERILLARIGHIDLEQAQETYGRDEICRESTLRDTDAPSLALPLFGERERWIPLRAGGPYSLYITPASFHGLRS
jgi:hypothetical protein